MKNKKIEKLIYKSFDAKLTMEEQALLDRELNDSEELRNEYIQLQKLRSAVKESVDASFSSSFENSIYQKINNPQEIVSGGLTESLFKSFRQIVLTAAIILTILIIYNINNGNSSGIENLLGTYKTPLEYLLDPSYHLLGSAI